MKNAEEYRAKAFEARQHAEECSDPEAARAWGNIGRQYDHLADIAERERALGKAQPNR